MRTDLSQMEDSLKQGGDISQAINPPMTPGVGSVRVTEWVGKQRVKRGVKPGSS